MEKYNSLITHLIEAGFTEKEAFVYLALIELGTGTAAEIAENSSIKRSSTYVILESLKKRGLVTISEEKKVKEYLTVSTNALFEEAKSQAEKAEEIKNKISKIILEIDSLRNDLKKQPKVRVFEGQQGLMNAFDEPLNCKEKMIRRVGRNRRDCIKNLGIKTSQISSKINNNTDILIYDNKISYLSPDKKGFAIIIESKEMADVMKNIFDLAYKEAKRIARRK